MKIRAALLSWWMVLGLALWAGCGPEAPPRPVAEAAPRRLVALAPSLAETLFVLGLGKRVVGVGDYSHWPPEVERLPRLGGLLDPSFEQIVALKPDLALVLPSQRDLAGKLGRLGIASLVVPSDSLTDVERSFSLIAERCGVPEAGRRLTLKWQQDLAPRPLPGGAPKFLLVAGRAPGRLTDLLIAGPGTFLDELARRAGGVNALADTALAWPQVSLEEVLHRAPDVIIELRSEPTAPEVVAALLRDWQSVPQLPAVRDGRISVFSGDYTTIPGPRLPILYRQLLAALAPGGAAAR